MLSTVSHKLRLLFLLLSCTAVAQASQASDLSDLPSGLYELDKTHASIVWKIDHMGMSTYVGRFTDFDIILDLDATNYKNSSAQATIKTNSVSTEYPYPEKTDFNQELATGKSWFNANQFPEITFKSSSLTVIDAKQAMLEGELTLLGVSKPVTLNLTLNDALTSHPFKDKPAIGFSATTTIKRKDWGLVKFLPAIGNEVQIEIEAEFIGK